MITNIEKKLYQRNIYLIYLLFAFYSLGLGWLVVEILYYQTFNLNYFQIGIISLLSALVILLLEIPTGAFADLYGKKKSLIITTIFLFIGSIFYTYSSGFIFFIIGAIFFSSAQAFYSGAGSALIYESLKKIGKNKNFEKVNSRVHFIFLIFGILTNLLIPIIFENNKRLPFEIGLIFSSLAIFTSFFIYETKNKKNKKIDKIIIKYYKQIFESSKYLFERKKILWLISFTSFWGIGMGLFAYLINQPFIANSYSLKYYAIIFSLSTIVQSLIIFFSEPILRIFRKSNIYYLLTLIWSLGLLILLLFQNNIFILIIIMGILWSVGSFTYIAVETDFNKLIKKDNLRATTLSIQSMARSLIVVIISPIFGYLLDIITLNQSIVILSIYSIIIGTILILIKKKFK